MHLLLAQKGSIQEGEEAVDLGQAPADIVFISAADTELASMASAYRDLDDMTWTLRLANLMQLTHPMSVDVYCENTIIGSRAVVLRVLGGKGYWPYGIEKLEAICRSRGILLAVLPGDEKPDPDLTACSTIEPSHCRRLQEYLAEGGPDNARNCLRFIRYLLCDEESPSEPVPLIRAGLWSKAHGVCTPEQMENQWDDVRPGAAIVFYRALVQSGGLAAISAMQQALEDRGVNALPIFVSSLKDPVCEDIARQLFGRFRPDIVLNATGFALSAPGSKEARTVLDESGCPVLQLVLSGSSSDWWAESSQGMSARDLAMNVSLPEIDGRVLTRAVAFKRPNQYDERVQANIVSHEPMPDRIEFVADLTLNWLKLRGTQPAERRVALVLANYPNRDGRIGNGVGLDTPAGAVQVLQALIANGYQVAQLPESGNALIDRLLAGPTNAGGSDGFGENLSMADYKAFFDRLPEQIQKEINAQWGDPSQDPFFDRTKACFNLSIWLNGNVAIGIQPARGYNIDPKQTYHSPDLVPPHGYLAFHCWLRNAFETHAVIHLGKHGNLEWLPGKALALSARCYPEAVLGPTPNLYPFIVNDPGEGSQAKRRMSAVIIDHLTPPLTRAESYGPLRDLESLVDEYYEASGTDPRRLKFLGRQIFELVEDIGLDRDAGLAKGDTDEERLNKLDAWLCELKELQIRDGLHVFGQSPEGRLAEDLAVAMVRVPRGDGKGAAASLQRAIAADLSLGFDPLDCQMSEPWDQDRPKILSSLSDAPWRTVGDAVERVEILATELVAGNIACQAEWNATGEVLDHVRNELLPMITDCGAAELGGLLRGLDGRFVNPGPSGAPTRGRLDVLPTGRNFYSVDSRSVPTQAAWALGQQSAELLITRYRQDNGTWPQSFGLSAWGTSNMRTGGDDIAQAMALIGARPVWDHRSRRVTGYETIPIATLGRPRVDVTLRISGFFRDAFPLQIELFDSAIRAIGELDEDGRDNPIAERIKSQTTQLTARGESVERAQRIAGQRIFGSKPGAYGAGLQALIDEKGWNQRGELAEAYLSWGGYAYGARETGEPAAERFAEQLAGVQAVVQNQDNREHDLLDSDDYYQFQGGMTVAVEQLSGQRPAIYHNDHSRPEKPVIRSLEEEIARVVRGRAANPKWISGVMRHGYKGAFEMAATLDYLFAFSATTGAVADHHFGLVYDAWLVDDNVRDFIAANNPNALREMADRFLEAIDRGLWTPRSNSAKFELERLAGELSDG